MNYITSLLLTKLVGQTELKVRSVRNNITEVYSDNTDDARLVATIELDRYDNVDIIFYQANVREIKAVELAIKDLGL
ncbi:hypothetical protein [Elizabethkingia phage TCUEAP1]|nr:hypothetical protein [Elizabethkingia phage TCUEAP1]